MGTAQIADASITEGKIVSLNADVISSNDETNGNIRINDYAPAKKFYNQTQSIRQYYDFNDVDVDRYTINGDYTQTFLSAREINEEKRGMET